MTRIFKRIVVGGMLVGLMVASLGSAQAETYSGGANGGSFEWTIPTVGLPRLDVTLNGETYTVGGENAIGGKLNVSFRASDWLVSDSTVQCSEGQAGSNIALVGKTPGATLKAVYTPLSGVPTELSGPPVDNKYPTAHFGLCI